MTDQTPEQPNPGQAVPPTGQPTPIPQSGPAPTPTPTPASVQGDVPVESWKSSLGEAKESPIAARHEHLSALLDDLDTQVGSL